MLQVHGLSQATTDPLKGGKNEDCMAYLYGPEYAFAAVGDGVTQPKDVEGKYPVGKARDAAILFVSTMLGMRPAYYPPDHLSIAKAFAAANSLIKDFNEGQECYDVTDWAHLDRAGTTAAAVWVDGTDFNDGTMNYNGAFLGDTVILQISGDMIKMVSRDQLKEFHDYRFGPQFRPQVGETREGAMGRMQAYQRQLVRNSTTSKNPDTDRPMGFGVLDGNPEAEGFVEFYDGVLKKGDILIIASDALRVLADKEKSDPDNPDQFKALLPLLWGEHALPADKLPRAIIALIRLTETEKNARVDDASVVVIANV